jgi:hypothetical protein
VVVLVVVVLVVVVLVVLVVVVLVVDVVVVNHKVVLVVPPSGQLMVPTLMAGNGLSLTMLVSAASVTMT